MLLEPLDAFAAALDEEGIGKLKAFFAQEVGNVGPLAVDREDENSKITSESDVSDRFSHKLRCRPEHAFEEDCFGFFHGDEVGIVQSDADLVRLLEVGDAFGAGPDEEPVAFVEDDFVQKIRKNLAMTTNLKDAHFPDVVVGGRCGVLSNQARSGGQEGFQEEFTARSRGNEGGKGIAIGEKLGSHKPEVKSANEGIDESKRGDGKERE